MASLVQLVIHFILKSLTHLCEMLQTPVSFLSPHALQPPFTVLIIKVELVLYPPPLLKLILHEHILTMNLLKKTHTKI